MHNTVHGATDTRSDKLETLRSKEQKRMFLICNEELHQQKQIVRAVEYLERENPHFLSKLSRNENICRKFPSPLLLSKMAY